MKFAGNKKIAGKEKSIDTLKRQRGHAFLPPKAIMAKIPPLYATEHEGLKAVAQVKFFTPDSG